MVFRDRRERGVIRLSGSSLSAYPVGSIYFNTTLVDPAAIFGGTWARFGQGKVLVGVDETDADFDTPLETQGAKTHVLTRAEMAEHIHNPGSLTADTGPAAQHTHSGGTYGVGLKSGVGTAGGAAKGNTTAAGEAQVTGASATGSGHSHDVTGQTGGVDQSTGAAHNNLQPLITVYMWRRTA